TRIVMIRLPAANPRLLDTPGNLAPQASVAADLASFGIRVIEPAAVDQRIAAFLGGGTGGGLDQIDSSAYRALAEALDRNWLLINAAEPAAGRSGTVSLVERRARNASS